MRLKSVVFCLIIAFTLVVSFTGRVLADDLKIETGLEAGYRIDDFKWNIAGNIYGQNPNILSELSWKDLKIYQIKAYAKIELDEKIFIQSTADYGIIMSGENQDSDYSGDNRTGEFSRSNNSSNGDDVGDFSIAIGRYITPPTSMFRIAPLFGYSYNWQNLRMTDGYQTIDTTYPYYTGPISGLDSTYKAKWKSLWFGVNLEGDINSKWSILGSFEYHLADYTGKGNWNLRDDWDHPVSFLHSANGDGYTCSVGTAFSPNDQWQISLKYHYSSWSTGNGTDRTYFANGAIGITQVNEAVWHSEAFVFTITQKF